MFWCWLWVALAADRVELPVAVLDEVKVVPAGDDGLVLYVQRKGDKKTYEITGYDTQFEVKWTGEHDVGKQQVETAWDADGEHAWVLLQRGLKHVNLLKTDLDSGATTEVDVELARKILATDLLRADGSGGAWVAGRGARHGSLTWVDAQGGSHPVELGKKKLVQNLALGDDGTVHAAVRDLKPKPGAPLTVLDLKEGRITGTRQVAPDAEKILLSGRGLDLEGDDMVVGTWMPRGLLPGARGMYVAGFDGQGQTWFRPYAWADFENFLAFLPDKKEERLEKKVSRKKDKGNTPNIRYNLLVHDPIQSADGITLVAEAYYPVYQTRTRTVVVPNGQGGTTTQIQTYTVFVGFRFTHALVVAFDREGNRRWDHSFPLYSRLTSVLSEHVRLLQEGDQTSLIYAYKNKLQRALIEGDELVIDQEALTPDDVGGDDTLKNLEGDAAWWYGDSFLVYGVDRVREAGEKKERVFFFSRLDGDGASEEPAPEEPAPEDPAPEDG